MSDERFDSRADTGPAAGDPPVPGPDPELGPEPDPEPDPQPEPHPQPEQAETADVLRRALRSEATRVLPAADGLHRIRAAIAAERSPTVRRLPRPRSRWQRFTPLLAAAAATGVLVVVAGAVIHLDERSATPLANGRPTTVRGLPVPGPTTPAPTGLNTSAPTGPAGPTGPGTSAPTAPNISPPEFPLPSSSGTALVPGQRPPALPVYVAAEQGGKLALFREFRATTATDRTVRVAEALTDAVDDRPLDPDYTTLFSGGRPGRVLAQVTPELITVQLTPAMATNAQATRAQAEMALQQLVWTATATAALPDTPVRVVVKDGPQSLFGLVPLDHAYARGATATQADPRAPVWITSLADNTTIGRGPLTVTGDGVNEFENTLEWVLRKDGDTVAQGSTSPVLPGGQQPTPGQRGTWSIQLDISAPGSYELTVRESTPTAQAVAWQDTKTFLVN